MLKDNRSTLDYSHLLRRSQQLFSTSVGGKLRLALLADVSTQRLASLIRVLFADNGIDVEIYEAGFDTIELEAYDVDSRLYSFNPQVVVILQTVVKLKLGYYVFSGARQEFHLIMADRIEGVWKAIFSRIQPHVVQSTFMVPYDRPFGNFGGKQLDQLQAVTMELNREICRRASKSAGVLL